MDVAGSGSFMAFFTGGCAREDEGRVIVSTHPNRDRDPDVPAVCIKIAQGTLYLTHVDAERVVAEVAALLTRLDALEPQGVTA